MRSLSWRLILRVITVLSWLLAILWFVAEPGYEPLIAVVTGIGTLLGSFAVSDAPISDALKRSLTAGQRQRNRRAMLEGEAGEKAVASNISTLDNYEKAVLREFFIQKRNTIRVPEEDIAVSGLLQKGIISIVGDAKFLLGVGWTSPVSLSPSARSVLLNSGLQIIGFPPDEPDLERITEIKNLRPDFVWRIKRSDW